MDGRTLIANAPLDRSRRAPNNIPESYKLYGLRRHVLCTLRIVTVVNPSTASRGNNGMTSLAAVSFYWSAVRVSDGFPRFRGVICGRSKSVRRSSARFTGFCASILYAVTAVHDNVTFKNLLNVRFFNCYGILLVMQ